MISFAILGKMLRLNPDTNIKFSLMFPDPMADTLPNSTVNWFSIPFCDENDETFKFARYIEISRKVRIYDCIFSAGIISLKGTLIVSEVSEFYKCSFTDYPFPKGFKDKLLTDLVYEIIDIGDNQETVLASANIIADSSYPTYDIAFPIVYAAEFYPEGVNLYFQKYMNAYIHRNYDENILGPYYVHNDLFYDDHANFNTLVPMPYLLAVIKRIFSSVNFNITGDFTANADVMKLILFNNTSIDRTRGNSNYVEARTTSDVEKILNDDIRVSIDFDEEIDPSNVFDLDNGGFPFYYNGTGGLIHVQLEMDVLNLDPDHDAILGIGLMTDPLNTYWDFKSDLYTIYRSQTWERILLSFDFPSFPTGNVGWKSFYFLCDFFDVSSIKYRNALLKIVPISYNQINLHNGQIDLKNHLPKISVSEFINQTARLLGVAVFTNPNSKQVEFEFWNTILDNQTYLDLTERVIDMTEEIVFEEKIYKLSQNFAEGEIKTQTASDAAAVHNIAALPSVGYLGEQIYLKGMNAWFAGVRNETDFTISWQKFADNFSNIVPENWTEDTELKLAALPMKLLGDYFGIPEYAGQGNSAPFNTGNTDIDGRLLFYHGMKANRFGFTFPLASADRHDHAGNALRSFSLRLNGTDGIYETLLKKLYEYWRRDTYKVNLDISEDLLPAILSLYSVKPKNGTRKIRIGNQNYIPLQIDFEIDMNDGVLNCQATLK